MKAKKRFLSILLSLALVLGLMPGMGLTAYAAGGTEVTQANVICQQYSYEDAYDGTTNKYTLNSAPPTDVVNITLAEAQAFGAAVTCPTTYWVVVYAKDGDNYKWTSNGKTGEQISSPRGRMGAWTELLNNGVYYLGSFCDPMQDVTFYFSKGLATVAVTGVSLDKTTAQTINVGGKVSFTATVAPDNATDKTVKWSVGETDTGAVKLYTDEACTTEVGADATENLTVYAKGVKVGSATVTVTTTDGNFTATCTVTVNKADPTAPTGLTATYGQTLSDVALPTGWTWADSTQSVGNVGSNTFKANFAGNDNYNAASDVDVTVTVSRIDYDGTKTAFVNLLGVKDSTAEVTLPALPDGASYGTVSNGYDRLFTVGEVEDGKVTVTALKDFEKNNDADDKYFRIAVTGATNYNNYNVTVTITPTFKQIQTITAADVTVAYGDTGKKIEASTTSGGGALSYAVKSGDAVTVDETTGALTIVKAGSAVITVTAAETDTYAKATKDVNVTVNTKAMTISAEDVNVTVDGQPHGITVNVTEPATGYTVKYGTETGSYTLDASPTQTEVGEKIVYYQVTADNYTTYTGSAKVTVSAKQTQTITAENVTVNYGDTDKKVTATTNGNGAISYAVKDGSGDYIEVNASTGTLTIKKVGTATVIVTAAETSTYTQASKEVTVTINKANAVAATVTANNRTFDGTEKPLVTVTGEATGGTMQYALGTSTETTEPYTTSIPTATNAGTYYVWYKVVGDENHTDTEAQKTEVSIAKSAINPTLSIEGWTYGEESKAPSVTGNTGNGTVTYTYAAKGSTDFSQDAPSEAGEYTVKASIAESNNCLAGTATTDFTIAKAAATVTAPTAQTLTYTGSVQELVTSGTAEGGTMQYALGTEDNATEEYSTAIPAGTNAGTYYTWYKAIGDDNHTDTVGTGPIMVTIGKKDVTVSGITAADKNYDGTTIAALDCSEAAFDGKLEGDTLSVTATGTFADANVGENKTVTISGLTLGGASAGNYQLAAEGQQKSTTASITANELSITASNYTGTYDGETHQISVTTEDTGVSITYAEAEEGTYSETNPGYTNAGVYTVYYKAEKTGSTTVSGSKTVTINKKDVTVSGITAAGRNYDGTTTAALDCSAAMFDGKLEVDTLSVTATGAFADANVGENKIVTISGLTLGGEDAGNYQLAAEGQQLSTTASITANALSITASDYTGSYDGETHQISVTTEDTGVSITYAEAEEGTYSETNPGYVNVGVYTVYYKAEKTGSTTVSGSKTVTINKKDVTVSGITAADKNYDGTTTAALDCSKAAFDGKLEGDTLSVTATGAFADANVGENKTVTISGLTLGGESSGNYQLAAEGQQTSTTASITAKELTAAASDVTAVYDGKTHSIGVTVTGPETYSIAYGTAEGTYGAENPALTDAGTITVYYQVTADNYGTYTGSAKVTVTPKEAGLTWSDTAFTYDGGSHVPTAKATGILEGDTCTVTVTGEQSAAGSYTATAAALSNPNYQLPQEQIQAFTIARANASVTAPTANSLTYSSAAQTLVTAGSASGGTLQYALGTDGTTAPDAGWGESLPAGTEAKTYYVWYKVSGDANHNDTTPACIAVTIRPDGSSTGGVTGNTLTYNGTAQTLVTEGTASGGTLLYALGENAETAPAEGWSASVPTGTDVKDYFVWYKVVGDENHNDSAPACVTVSIAKKDISNAAITLSTLQFAYNGTEHAVSVADVAYDGSSLPSDAYEVTGSLSGTNAGTYTVTITGKGNYTGEASMSWSITPGVIQASAENVTVPYDGNAHGITVVVTEPAGGYSIRYGTADGTYDLTESPSLTEAGNLQVFYQVTAENYTAFTGSASITVEAPEPAPEPGDIKSEVHVSGGAPQTTSDISEETAKAVLTEAETAALETGESILVYLDVEGLSEGAVPAADLQAAQQLAGEGSQTIALYLDVTLWKRVGDADAVQIHETNGKAITFTVQVPAELQNVPEGYTRIYRLIRIHEGVATVVAESTGTTLSAFSDEFSTYVLTYEDVENTEPTVTPEPTTTPEPTATPEPTITLEATVTPQATATPVPAAAGGSLGSDGSSGSSAKETKTADNTPIGLMIVLLACGALESVMLTREKLKRRNR